MYWLTNILLFLSGAAGASSLITSRFPEFQETVIRINRFKGLLGFVLLLLAVGNSFDLIFGGFYSGWFMYVLEILLMFALGLIQGLGIVKQLIQNQRFTEKLEHWKSRILPYEEMLGLTAMVLAVFSVLKYVF